MAKKAAKKAKKKAAKKAKGARKKMGGPGGFGDSFRRSRA